MPVTMISGARSTEQTGAILSARKIVDMGDMSQLEDDKILLTKLVQQVAKKPTKNPLFNYLTDEITPKEDAVNNGAGYASGDTSIVVDNGGYFRAKDIIKVPRTGETIHITSISSNTLTVERSVGATAAAALVDNDPFLILGNTSPEGGTLGASRSTTEVNNTAYCQIMRDSYHLTGTEQAMGKAGGLYGGDDQTLQRTKKLLEHMRNWNLIAYHGENAAATSTIGRTAGGVYEAIPTANRDSVSVLTEAEFNDGLRSAFRYGSSSKIMFCSRFVAGIINEYMQNVQRVSPGDSKFGVKMVEYTSPHGDLKIVTDHALEGTTYNGHAYVLDLAQCKYRFLAGRDTQLLMDRQAVDEDGVKEEYLTEAGFEWGEGRRHYAFNSISS